MLEYHHSKPGQKPKTAKGWLWIWFALGFAVVFIGFCVEKKMYSLTPSGDGVIVCKLWRYYIIEIHRALHSSGMLGPTTGSTSAAVGVALTHLLISLAGGAATLGIAWSYCKFKGR